jgi:hypothetical protein
MRASTSASQACGSTSLSFAVVISVVIAAARSAPRSKPANSHGLRPRAKPRIAHSAALFQADAAILQEAGQPLSAPQHVVDQPPYPVGAGQI